MKKILLVLSSFLLGNCCYAQTQLWGMTELGGQYGTGSIFYTDSSGNNATLQPSFFQIDGANPYMSELVEATDGKFYGMTQQGGVYGNGTIFQYNPVTNVRTKKHDFAIGSPRGSLMQASNGKLYGMTTNTLGSIFEYDPVTSVFTGLISFDGPLRGANPSGSLIQASDGMLYGMAYQGGIYNFGVLFQFNPFTNVFTKKLDFDGPINGRYPMGSLMEASDGMLYGLVQSGGTNSWGVLFQYDPSNSIYTVKLNFTGTANGSRPYGYLIQATDGMLYGMTTYGGVNNYGVLFQYDPVLSIYTKKLDFAGTTTGKYPNGSLVQAMDGNIYGMTYQGGVNTNFGVLFQYNPITSGYTKKLDFAGATNGNTPYGTLMSASDGMLYGMTNAGGLNNLGVLFQYDPFASTYSKKLDFAGATNGSKPYGSLMQASDGKLYGMTNAGGGGAGYGVLFQCDPVTFSYTKKFDFGSFMGSYPVGSLIQASDGMLYGLTPQGGVNNMGILFQFNPATSAFIKKLDFAGTTNGSSPGGSLMQASDGMLYGLTSVGGIYGAGVLFRFNTITSTYTKMFDFDGPSSGSNPSGSLMQASDGMLYGTTWGGGANNGGVLFQFDPATSVYIDKFDFSLGTNGYGPDGGSLIQASDGKLYGMTSLGGDSVYYGVLFQYDPISNVYSKMVDFVGETTGCVPRSTLMQASDGNLYGMTGGGGINNFGVLFQFDPATSIFTKKIDFNGTNGRRPFYSNLIEIAATFSISTSAVTTSHCPGSSIIVPYTISGGFYSGNVFTAQLSDATGSFSNPVIIGTDTSIFGGAINATIPALSTAGSGYRIRVISSSPFAIGSDNGSNITINASPIALPGSIISPGCSASNGSVTASFSGGTPPYNYAWFPGNISSLTDNNIPVGTYTFNVTDSNNCIDSTIIALSDSCNYVWPGDANEDAVADNNDILAIGIANGATGTTRANANINWIGQPSANWNQTLLNGTNYKFIDCDGDGIIQPTDTIAVIQNFGLTHILRLGPPPNYDASLPDLKITMVQDTIPSNSIGTMTVSLGSAAVQVSNLYGIAFTINFDAAQIDASTFRMNENGTWMGIPGNNLMGVVMNSGTGTGSVQIAITRLDQLNANGFGNIANLSFMTTNALTGTGLAQNVVFSISNVTAISASEIGQTVNTVNDAVVVADPSVITGISSNENPPNIFIYPNPSSGIFTLTSTFTNAEISICNLLGENIFQSTINNQPSTIDLSDKPNGIYFITVKTENNYYTQKIVIQK